jgi:hypothetical protein
VRLNYKHESHSQEITYNPKIRNTQRAMKVVVLIPHRSRTAISFAGGEEVQTSLVGKGNEVRG